MFYLLNLLTNYRQWWKHLKNSQINSQNAWIALISAILTVRRKNLMKRALNKIFYYFAALLVASSVILLVSFVPALAVFSGVLKEISFIVFMRGLRVMRDYWLNNIDDVDSYIKNSMLEMTGEIALKAAQSSAVQNMVSSAFKSVTNVAKK
jgi:hypothetical protein